MNFDTLRNFKSVIDAGSFSKAAQNIFASQQGLNKSITALEHELGCTLLKRTQHGVTLTENGTIFLSHVEKILNEYTWMLDDLSTLRRDIDFLKTTDVRIVVSPACMHNILSPMIERFALDNIIFQELTTRKAFENMGKPGWLYLVDLFAQFYPKDRFREAYEEIPIINAKIGILARKSTVPNLLRSVSREYVAKLPLGIFDNETTQAMYRCIFKDCPFENILLSTASRSTLLANMFSGRIVALVDSFQWQQLPPSYKEGPNKVVFSEIEGNNDIAFSFVYQNTDPLDDTQRAYIRSFRKVFKAMVVNH
jgi:hypothetical protein